jgi:hypothetical protein
VTMRSSPTAEISAPDARTRPSGNPVLIAAQPLFRASDEKGGCG